MGIKKKVVTCGKCKKRFPVKRGHNARTCKKVQYEKLFKPLLFQVEYVYVLNDWFRQYQYRDEKIYIKETGCHYYFNEIPLDFLNLK